MSKSALLVIDLQNKYLPTGKLLDHRLRSLFATVPFSLSFVVICNSARLCTHFFNLLNE